MTKSKTIILLTIAGVFLFSAYSLSMQTVSDFKIGFMIDKVFLKWKSTIEDTVEEYAIERSLDKVAFTEIGKLKPKGNYKDYSFIDKNIFKASSRTFYYRLKISNKDNSAKYSKILEVSPRVSSAKQTWGSIKAIFH
jgi:hypothetical protein